MSTKSDFWAEINAIKAATGQATPVERVARQTGLKREKIVQNIWYLRNKHKDRSLRYRNGKIWFWKCGDNPVELPDLGGDSFEDRLRRAMAKDAEICNRRMKAKAKESYA